MSMLLTDINWVAVIVAAIAYCLFSGMWHRQFAFGRKWEKAMGFIRPQNWKETRIYFVVPLISCFVVSITMHIVINLAGVSSLKAALTLGLIAGAGFATTTTFTNAVIPIMKKPVIFGAITGTAHAIGITIVSILVYIIAK